VSESEERVELTSRTAWHLVGAPAPQRAERLGHAVGLRVVWLPGTRRVLVVAGTVDRLRDLLVDPAGRRPTTSATIVVAGWRYPRPGWSGTVEPLQQLRRHRVSLPRLRLGTATVRLVMSRPVPLRDAVRAALRALDGGRPLPAPTSADLTGHGSAPPYLPARATIVGTAEELPGRTEIRAHDLVIHEAGRMPARGSQEPTTTGDGTDPRYGAARAVTGHALMTRGGRPVVLIDAERINPRGRRAVAYRPDACRVRLEFGPYGHRRIGTGLDAGTLATLRQVAVIECGPVPDDDPVQSAGLLVQLAATGAVLHTPVLPSAVAELISPELRELLGRTPPADAPAAEGGSADTDDSAAGKAAAAALAMEARSVRQRRAALRDHALGFALPRAIADTNPGWGRLPSVSAILVTRRPELVTAALAAITAQTYPELEIVLGLHGVELPDAARAALSECGRPFEIVHVPAGVSFGAALGAATRRARGTLVTKFDDDDSYGVEHVWDLVLARHYSGATLVGKGTEFIYLETQGVTLRRLSGLPEAYGDVVAGGTMLLAKGDLEAVGGWRPVPRSVDLGLIERLRAEGATMYRTHPLGYLYHRRPSGHTWDPGERYFVDSSFARWDGIPADAFGDPERHQPVSPRAPIIG